MNFTYRGTNLKGELIEETNTHYIFNIEGDQRSFEKELTALEKMPTPYEKVITVGDKSYIEARFDLKGNPRKNGKVIKRTAL